MDVMRLIPFKVKALEPPGVESYMEEPGKITYKSHEQYMADDARGKTFKETADDRASAVKLS